MKISVFLPVVSVLASGMTPYEPKTDPMFSSTAWSRSQPSRDTLGVHFIAREKEEECIRDFVLLRTAKLSLSHCFTHFTILEQSVGQGSRGGETTPVIVVGGRHGTVIPVIASSASSDRNSIRNRIHCYPDSQSGSRTEYEASSVRSLIT